MRGLRYAGLMRNAPRTARLGFLCAALGMAWQTPAGAGHWEGVIKGNGKDVAITVDLAVDANGGWTGSMGMPAQGARDIPLSGITVQADAVHFRMFDAAESPVFDGKLAAGGSAMSGQVSGSGESTAFELKRAGDAVIQAPPASTPLSNDFVGTWEGLLPGGPGPLHLELKLAQGAGGIGAGRWRASAWEAVRRFPSPPSRRKTSGWNLRFARSAGLIPAF